MGQTSIWLAVRVHRAGFLPRNVSLHAAFLFALSGKVVNIQRLNAVLDTLNGWYRDRGLFGQVSEGDSGALL